MTRAQWVTQHLYAGLVFFGGCSGLQQAESDESSDTGTAASGPSGEVAGTGREPSSQDGRPDGDGASSGENRGGTTGGGTTGGVPSDDGSSADDDAGGRAACCSPSTLGCDQPDIAACVCEISASCCVFAWDESCADVAVNECGGCDRNGTTGGTAVSSSTGMGVGEGSSGTGGEQGGSSGDRPVPGGACCETSATPGCGGGEVEACVCALDEYCCNQDWDEQCVAQVVEDCMASC